MKQANLLFLALIIFSSCAKKEEWAVYKDPKYPLAIKHLSKKMKIEPYQADQEKEYWLNINIDIGDEFPEREVIYQGLYDVVVRQPEHFEGFSRSSYEISYEETDLNGIPAIASKDEKGRIRKYILLIPNIYTYLWLSGVDIRRHNPDDITQAESDRVEQLTYEMIKHFKWEQQIDTSSEEFKAWKKHIWEILTTPKEKK